MRRSIVLVALAFAGCSSREERDAVSTTTITSAPESSVAFVGETKSGLRVNLEQSPTKLTLRRGERVIVFRADGAPSRRLPGALEFGPTATLVTKEGLDDAHDGDPTRFVETFGQALYGDPEKVTPPALSPDWNAVVLVTEQGRTTAETVSLRKVRR